MLVSSCLTSWRLLLTMVRSFKAVKAGRDQFFNVQKFRSSEMRDDIAAIQFGNASILVASISST